MLPQAAGEAVAEARRDAEGVQTLRNDQRIRKTPYGYTDQIVEDVMDKLNRRVSTRKDELTEHPFTFGLDKRGFKAAKYLAQIIEKVRENLSAATDSMDFFKAHLNAGRGGRTLLHVVAARLSVLPGVLEPGDHRGQAVYVVERCTQAREAASAC